MAAVKQTVDHVASLEADKYKHGFVTDIAQEFADKGLSADTVRFISAKKGEPQWMLDWRLEAFARWLVEVEPARVARKIGHVPPRDLLALAEVLDRLNPIEGDDEKPAD